MSYLYVANPYSSDNPRLVQWRYTKVLEAVAALLSRKCAVYSPIVHCHELAAAHGMPTDAAFWSWYNTTMQEASSGLVIYTLPGWTCSVGVLAEFDYAHRRNQAVYFMDDNASFKYTTNPAMYSRLLDKLKLSQATKENTQND